VANPAELLYNNLVQWNPPNLSTQTTPENQRQLRTNRDHALRMHEIALGYIAQIRELLDTLDQLTGIDVDEYRRELPNWTAVVLAYPNGWNAAEQFNDTSMRFLKTLGPMLRGLVPTYSDEDIAEIAEGLNELLQLLSKEKTLSKELAIYLLNLINHIRWVLHDYHLRGDFEVARAVTLLRDSLGTASEFSTDPELKPWYKRLLQKFARKDVVMSAMELTTAAAKAISAVEALPPGTGLS
jgi:hypothetical protein